ncbi:hypothetical protein CDCA_CDCA02G0802 [Cyanidium caldarium]|uniref:Uncharacterized protein n=1 Tax=Cyanidium caldarium TaxID=2771 RepID=A0AAV9IQY1_CYACA|nr:hypothetical protein CDCA_CDCA02G0802 [Cyanidium caldarium]
MRRAATLLWRQARCVRRALLSVFLLLAVWRPAPRLAAGQSSGSTQSSVLVHGARCTFNITFMEPYDGRAMTAFTYAAARWADVFPSAVPIRVFTSFVPKSPPNSLGTTFAYLVMGDTVPGLLRRTWYNSALAVAIIGRADASSTPYDMEINLNDQAPWHYDPSTPIDLASTPNAIDLATTVLHEIAHGLGFSGTITADASTQTARYGLAFDTHYGYPAFSVPGRFDSLITDVVGCGVLDACSAHGDGALYQALTTLNSLYIGGADGGHFMLYSPDPYNAGTNVYQFSPTTWKRDCVLANVSVLACSSLVTPYALPGEQVHQIGENTLTVLQLLLSNQTLPSTPPNYCSAACVGNIVLAADSVVRVAASAGNDSGAVPDCGLVNEALATAMDDTLLAFGFGNATAAPRHCIFNATDATYVLSTVVLGMSSASASSAISLLTGGSSSNGAGVLLQSSLQNTLGPAAVLDDVNVARVYALSGSGAPVLQPPQPLEDALQYTGLFLFDWQIVPSDTNTINETAFCADSRLPQLLHTSAQAVLQSELSLEVSNSTATAAAAPVGAAATSNSYPELPLLPSQSQCLLYRAAPNSAPPPRYNYLFTIAVPRDAARFAALSLSAYDKVAAGTGTTLSSAQLSAIFADIAPPGTFGSTDYVQVSFQPYDYAALLL